MIAGALFDFDGTLVSSLECWLTAYQYALRQYGWNISDEEVIERCFYTPFSEIATTFNIPDSSVFHAHVNDDLTRGYQEVLLYTGAAEFIKECHKNGLKLGLVTSSTLVFVEPALARLGLSSYFGSVVTSSEVKELKPSPKPVQRALQDLDLDPTQTIMVGDHHVDVVAGRAAGTWTALHLPESHSRFYDFSEIRASEPHLEFTEYHQLSKWIATL